MIASPCASHPFATTPTTTPSASANGCRVVCKNCESCGLSKYGLARESGISREYIGKIERGVANPTLPVTAQISHGLGMTLEQFTGELEDDTE